MIDDAEPLEGPVEGPPELVRLSRYDGASFAPVARGSVDAPVVHVVVHGWQPGLLTTERLLAASEAGGFVPSWDPRLGAGAGRSLVSYFQALLDAFAGLGDDHAVLWYSWADAAATPKDVFAANLSLQATQINGRRLSYAVQEALARPGGAATSARRQRLHLVGHSHGSAVVVHAAATLPRAPAQLTLLDAPENLLSRAGGAADLVDLVLPRIHPGRGPADTFVDSYSTVFGRAYHRLPGLAAVVDVRLTSPPPTRRNVFDAVNLAHVHPLDWYASTVADPGCRVGYGWSALAGGDPRRLHPQYVQLLPGRPYDLRRVPQAPVTPRPREPRRREVDGVLLRLSDDVPGAGVLFDARAQDYLLEFDIEPGVPGPGVHRPGDRGVGAGGPGDEATRRRGRLDLAVDGVPAFVSAQNHHVPASGRYLLLTQARAGEHLLTGRLTGVPPGTSVTVRARRLVALPWAAANLAPEQRPALLLGIGAVGGAVVTLAAGLLARFWRKFTRKHQGFAG